MANHSIYPLDNTGQGNCVYNSVAYQVWGKPFSQLLRSMVVDRLMKFPSKYCTNKSLSEFKNQCQKIVKNCQSVSFIEIQAISDIFYATIECYSTTDYNTPTRVIKPLRQYSFNPINTIRLWIKDDRSHCLGLLQDKSPILGYSPV